MRNDGCFGAASANEARLGLEDARALSHADAAPRAKQFLENHPPAIRIAISPPPSTA
jgi:hypothetical protein